MKVPSSFPAGCRFGLRSEGGFFVEIPGKSWFALSSDGASLSARPHIDSRGPISEWFDRSEADFLAESEALRAAA